MTAPNENPSLFFKLTETEIVRDADFEMERS